MRKLVTPLGIIALTFVVLAGGALSANFLLWLKCAAAAVAVIWILGGRRAPIALLWICAMTWLQVAADVLLADLNGTVLDDAALGYYSTQAIEQSLTALVVLALGMRFGNRLGRLTFRREKRTAAVAAEAGALRLQRLLLCYFVARAVVTVLGIVAHVVPALEQPLLTLGYLRYAFLYLVALQIFEKNRGYGWLSLIMAFEISTGMIAFFSEYKEPILITLFAFVASRRRVNMPAVMYGAAAIVCVTWLSLIWAEVKPEFRAGYGGRGVHENLSWMSERIFSTGVDYNDAAQKLVSRIGYTSLYAKIVERKDAGLISEFDLYWGAVEHILKPRLLFPNKAALNDSVLTTELTGIEIGTNTSIGVGYVSEAFVDFGFPFMLVPIGLIGVMLGWMSMYFLTRRVHPAVREAVAIATLFTQFAFAANIDKALGGCVIAFVGMALMLKYGYRLIAPWLAGPGRPALPYTAAPAGKVPT
jgi:hypothetical protein